MWLASGMEKKVKEEEEETVTLVAGRPLLTAPQFLDDLP